MDLPFHTLDVFTDRLFGGNPLAVVLDADALNVGQMQRIAREFNLSETVFVQQSTRADCLARARIFTPSRELPFAGHPTLGTACLLADLGRAPAGETVRFQLEEGAGPVRVSVSRSAGETLFAQLEAPERPQFGPAPPSAATLAGILGLEEESIGLEGRGPRFCSAGLPFLLVPLRSPEVLAAAELDLSRWRHDLSSAWSRDLYLYTRNYAGELQARMFGPDAGVPEDPATGSAAAALAGALALESDLAEGRLQWTIRQGLEMGRPSLLRAEAQRQGGEVTGIWVGGQAVRVMEGRLRVGVAG